MNAQQYIPEAVLAARQAARDEWDGKPKYSSWYA